MKLSLKTLLWADSFSVRRLGHSGMVRGLKLLAFELLLLLGLNAARADIIYDNTANWLGGYAFSALEQGEEVSAAGTSRWITDLTVGISHQNVSGGTAELVARLYANDGAQGAPGTLLWYSSALTVPLSGGAQLVSFSVPQVLVPDTFTWTLQVITNTIPAVGPVDGGTPTIGSSPNFFWFGHPGSWGEAQYPALMARIEAVPEPGLGVLLLGAVVFRRGRSLSRKGHMGRRAMVGIKKGQAT